MSYLYTEKIKETLHFDEINRVSTSAGLRLQYRVDEAGFRVYRIHVDQVDKLEKYDDHYLLVLFAETDLLPIEFQISSHENELDDQTVWYNLSGSTNQPNKIPSSQDTINHLPPDLRKVYDDAKAQLDEIQLKLSGLNEQQNEIIETRKKLLQAEEQQIIAKRKPLEAQKQIQIQIIDMILTSVLESQGQKG